MVGIDKLTNCLRCNNKILGKGKYKKHFCSLKCATYYHIAKYQKKKSIEWVAKGLCKKCGRERSNKDWKHCEKCRKMLRKKLKGG